MPVRRRKIEIFGKSLLPVGEWMVKTANKKHGKLMHNSFTNQKIPKFTPIYVLGYLPSPILTLTPTDLYVPCSKDTNAPKCPIRNILPNPYPNSM